jgi:hypothetical protein
MSRALHTDVETSKSNQVLKITAGALGSVERKLEIKWITEQN